MAKSDSLFHPPVQQPFSAAAVQGYKSVGPRNGLIETARLMPLIGCPSSPSTGPIEFALAQTTRALEQPLQHLNQNALAIRWRISPRSLERWRWLKQGPPYLKVGGKVLYRLTDVEAYEQAQLRQAGA